MDSDKISVLMDPPSFGRGSKNEVWTIENGLFELVSECAKLLSDDPLLFLINSYTTGLSKTILENILRMTVNTKYDGLISSDELKVEIWVIMAFFEHTCIFKIKNTYSHCGNIILANLKLVVYLSLHSREMRNIQKNSDVQL